MHETLLYSSRPGYVLVPRPTCQPRHSAPHAHTGSVTRHSSCTYSAQQTHTRLSNDARHRAATVHSTMPTPHTTRTRGPSAPRQHPPASPCPSRQLRQGTRRATPKAQHLPKPQSIYPLTRHQAPACAPAATEAAPPGAPRLRLGLRLPPRPCPCPSPSPVLPHPHPHAQPKRREVVQTIPYLLPNLPTPATPSSSQSEDARTASCPAAPCAAACSRR